MKSGFLAGSLLATFLLALQMPAAAEDIDLFIQPPAAGAVAAPNILILLDNTANWGPASKFANEMAALSSTLSNLPVNGDGSARFRVGLMLFTETGGANNNVDGGYVRAAIRDFTSANQTKYAALVNSLTRTGDVSNGGKAGKTMSEAYQYLKGLAPFSGNNKVKTDYTGNISGTASSNAIYALSGNAINSKPGSPYNSPVTIGGCGRNYIIYISNGAPADNNSDTTTATAQLTAAAAAESISGATTSIPISPSGSQGNVADEWARFMNQSSLGVVTYTVDVSKVTTGQGPGWTALLQSSAGVSGGKYFDVGSGSGGAEIANALGRIFSEIQAVNSVFASVSLPVSVNTEGTYLNQLFVGQFRPDGDAFPRWAGNLKQYKLGIVSGSLRTVDADDASAINSLTGFITECARSFWTPTTVDSYWAFRPQGGCLAVANSNVSNYPDGNIVEKGAQGYVLRSSTTRTIQTCSATFASCTVLTTFNNTNVTQAMLGAASTTERDALINWEKGLDVDNEDVDGVSVGEMRPSAHGDVVHSRPVAINFGTDASPSIVVFYGANDGVLRAVNGNRSASVTASGGSVAAGGELWGFVAPEFYTSIKRLRDNTTQVSFYGNTTTTPTPLPKPYGFDGPIASYKDASVAWIYPSMRRGGRVLYAFDVTNIAVASGSASAPTLKWKRGCPNLGDDTGCSSGFTEIGQTWSAPKLLKTSGYTVSGTPVPMLMMGGGYDNCEDADPSTLSTCSTTKGNHVYVMDANDGTVLRTFSTDRAVAGDVFVVPDGTTGLVKYAYAADLGGNIYRISGVDANSPFSSTTPDLWTITKIASLGCPDTGPCAAKRKFMFSPDVVEKVKDSGIYYLLVGSGDREKPLLNYSSAYGVSNYFFMVKDIPADTSWLSDEAGNCSGSSVICLNSLLAIANSGADPSAVSLAAKKGWYLGMHAHEQAVTSAITVFGTTTFSTHTPTVPVEGSCSSNLGTARVYNVKYSNAAIANGTINRDEVITGGGLPPSPVAGQVTLDNGTTVPFLLGGDPTSPLEGELPTATSSGLQPKSLTYWYIQK